jgi:diguanylate cyclase (GGDEF)-like protein
MTSNQPNRTSIIIIDDDPISRMQMRLTLEQEGYRVLLFNSCEAGIAGYTRYRPQLVVQALFESSAMNGFECCAQMRQLSGEEFVPIFMLMNDYNVGVMDRLLNAGAMDYLRRPIHPGILLQRVKVWLEYTKLKKQLKSTKKLLKENINIDLLTEISNRRRFDQYLQQEWARMSRDQSPIALLIVSIDFFDTYKNQYGEQAGDKCLQSVAQGLTRCLQRPGDFVARYDEREFALVLPKTDKLGTVYVGEKIRNVIRDLRIFHGYSPVGNWLTVTMGAVSVIPSRDIPPKVLIGQAEKALSDGQAQGHDRLCLAEF